jgi:hypothetical protein
VRWPAFGLARSRASALHTETRNPLRLFVFLLPLVLAACAGSGSVAPKVNEADLRTVPYTGHWSGTIKTQSGFSQKPPQDFEVALALEIGEKAFDVKLTRADADGSPTTVHVKPGTFAVRRFATNMVASSMTTGMSQGEPWVETWVFAMTLIDVDRMLGHWTRVVNNPRAPKENVDSKFSVIGMGLFTRSDPLH